MHSRSVPSRALRGNPTCTRPHPQFDPTITMPADTPNEARPPLAPGAKCDNRLETLLPDQTFDDLVFVAAARGLTRSEMVRHIIEQHLYGTVVVLRDQVRKVG